MLGQHHRRGQHIHLCDGKFYGYNSDPIGFLNSLKEAGYPGRTRAAVLGAGGAVRAVVYALARSGAESIIVLNRTAERGAFLVEDLTTAFPNCALGFEMSTMNPWPP
ncbi:MAG: hypothetical protein U0401_20705 [Anaerolineae bacterium]